MATELAQAYVQIMPSARGIQGSLSQLMGGEASAAGESAGRSLGEKLVGAALGIVSAAAIGQAFAAAISEGAALEQSLGGIETLFKESADTVKKNAAEAYRTAGMSANQYMELTTSFAASLLQSLGGDTEAAARISDMAMTDMSDNANKMGTDMERITDAYQGFAKQNYTMLDNLKLGYGGTKTEMERLLADAQKITGVKYDISNLSDVYEAIHVIQGELDITGTTAKEAATTLSGSLASMKAAFKNVLAQLTLGQDVGPALNALAETTTTFLVGNLLPAVWNILKALPGALVTFIKTAAPQMSTAFLEFFPQVQEGVAAAIPSLLTTAQTLINQLCSGFSAAYPTLLARGGEILQQLLAGVTAALPGVFQAALDIITSFVNTFIANYPAYMQTGTQVLLSLIDGLRQCLPQMLVAAGEAIASMLSGLIANLPQIISGGFQMMTSLIQGLSNALPELGTAAGTAARKVWDAIKQVDWLQLGKDIIRGMIDGIGAMAGALWDAAVNIAKTALNAIKSFFGIASPSRLMRDEVGRWIPAGIAAGMEGGIKPLTRAMDELAATAAGGLASALALNSWQYNQQYDRPAQEQSERPAFQQYIYFEQPMQAPDEIARTLRIQNTTGLAGAR